QAEDGIRARNVTGVQTCALPIFPSGVETDTGRVLGAAVRADRTVTFTLPKAGHFVGKGGLCTGRLTVADIGIPAELVDGEDYPEIGRASCRERVMDGGGAGPGSE